MFLFARFPAEIKLNVDRRRWRRRRSSGSWHGFGVDVFLDCTHNNYKETKKVYANDERIMSLLNVTGKIILNYCVYDIRTHTHTVLLRSLKLSMQHAPSYYYAPVSIQYSWMRSERIVTHLLFFAAIPSCVCVCVSGCIFCRIQAIHFCQLACTQTIV